MVKPEKFGYLHLVYHYTVPLKTTRRNLTFAKLQWELSKTFSEEFFK